MDTHMRRGTFIDRSLRRHSGGIQLCRAIQDAGCSEALLLLSLQRDAGQAGETSGHASDELLGDRGEGWVEGSLSNQRNLRHVPWKRF